MQNKIPEDFIEHVRQSNNIVDVIGEYVHLKKQGRNYFGLCPFHDEKTPSFSVTDEKQIFHCFGCKKGGNVITFLMEIENFPFQQALKHLADRQGIEFPKSYASQADRRQTTEQRDVLLAYEWLTKLYEHILKFTEEGKYGYEYLKQRGIEDHTIEIFQLGFAPNIQQFTANFLEKKGYDNQFLTRHQLLNLQEDGTLTDPFRNRVIFPIRNHLGKTIAFGGRTIHDAKPKYINSSDSQLFQKNKVLYNFDIARKYFRKYKQVVLFEGQMDVIAAYQAGVKHSVATLGTALTKEQARLLNRYVDEIIICYDADTAGQEATFRAANLLKQVGMQTKVTLLPDGYDPDQYIADYGSEAFQNLIENSDTYIKFYMKYLQSEHDLSIESERIEYIQKIIQEIAQFDSFVEREYYLKDLSDAFDLSISSLMNEVNNHRRHMHRHKDKSAEDRYTNTRRTYSHNERPLPAHLNAERKLLAFMLQDASLGDYVQEQLGINFVNEQHQVIATHLYAFYEVQEQSNISLFIEQIDDDKIKQVVSELGMIPYGDHITMEIIDDYIATIRRYHGNSTIKKYINKQKQAEKENNPIKAAEIATQILELRRNLKEVK